MKSLITILGTSILILASCSQGPQTPEDFFTKLQTAISENDQAALEKMIFSSPDDEYGMEIKQEILEGLANDNPQERGDGAYSSIALQILISQHLDKVVPIPNELYLDLVGDGDFNAAFKGRDKNDILIMDYNDCHILLVREQGRLQLVFWESLNNLIEAV
jgi:hypothetical protein